MFAPPQSFSVIVPIHNEAQIVDEQVALMVHALSQLGLEYEVILVENGSIDETLALGHALAQRYPMVRVLVLPTGNYGLAIKHGIENARYDIGIVFNVEFWELEFVRIALAALHSRALVIGSKAAPGAHDDRPWVRRTITRAYNNLLRLVWRFDGTDTHGMKAFRREVLVPLANQCVCDGFVFDTELVLRAQRAGLSILELPTDVRELRAPTTISLFKRIPAVMRNLWRLWFGLAGRK